MITFIRHYYTQYNIEKKFQSKIDLPIINILSSDKEKCLNFFKQNYHHNPIYLSSPQLRAIQTMEQLFDNQKYSIEKNIFELDFNIIDGHICPDVFNNNKLVSMWDNGHFIEGIESKENFQKRTESFLSSLDKNMNYIIITHGIFMRQIFCSILKKEFFLKEINDYKFNQLSILNLCVKNNNLIINNIYN